VVYRMVRALAFARPWQRLICLGSAAAECPPARETFGNPGKAMHSAPRVRSKSPADLRTETTGSTQKA
jgi:hypothetical protein